MKDADSRTEGPHTEKPLLVFDGDCDFCRWSVERLRMSTGEATDYAPYQKVADKYPNVPLREFEQAVHLFMPKGGGTYRAAEAVYRARALGGQPKRLLLALYQKSSAFRSLSEGVYRLIARNREAISCLSKFLWGRTLVPSTYLFSSWLFGRALGVVALIAFLSYWSQAEGLIGPNGIMPYHEDLERIKIIAENNDDVPDKYWLRPTLLWFSSTFSPDILFAAGVFCSLLLAIGVFPALACSGVWTCYLSLMAAGEPFLSFQWDILLLETCLLSVLFLPAIKFHGIRHRVHIPNIARLLLIGLLFKLMFESGIVKFTFFAPDGTNTWRADSAFDYHYWTQPIPNGLSWYIDQLPHWVDIFCLWLMFCAEIVLPFLFFSPRNLRHFALFGQVLLQVAILLSGNYGFFNLLTLALCLPLLDDQALPLSVSKFLFHTKKQSADWKYLPRLRIVLLAPLCVLFVWSGCRYLKDDFHGNRDPNASRDSNFEAALFQKLSLTHSMNSYGLFRVMTTSRPELALEASVDGENWEPYAFKWKPGDLKRMPGFVSPHMPRLDWQIWFEALNAENYIENPFPRFLYGRFLQIIGTGGTRDDFSRVAEVLGPAETMALAQAPPATQQTVLRNYNSLLGSFFGRSQWFAQFLEGLLLAEPAVLSLLESAPFGVERPNYLRVTLWEYRFASPQAKENGFWWERVKLDGFEVVLTAGDLP